MANLGHAALRKYWDDKKAQAEHAQKSGSVIIETAGKHRLQLRAPYRQGFYERAIDLGGRWRHRTKMWSFPWSNRRSVLELIRQTYGSEAMGSWATFKE